MARVWPRVLAPEASPSAPARRQRVSVKVAAFNAGGGPAPDDENPFNNPLHPDIRAAFDTAAAHVQAQATVVQACKHIIENSGWGTLQEVAMKRATAGAAMPST